MLLERNVRSEIENDGFWYDKYCEQNENNQLNSIAEAYQGLWFTVNEAGENIKPGKYKIAVVFYSSRENTEIGRSELSLEIKNARITAEAPLYTCWLHCDCLADIYKTEMFSDEHFRIIESFAKKAAETGMNTVRCRRLLRRSIPLWARSAQPRSWWGSPLKTAAIPSIFHLWKGTSA